jgi:hypothetical protein
LPSDGIVFGSSGRGDGDRKSPLQNRLNHLADFAPHDLSELTVPHTVGTTHPHAARHATSKTAPTIKVVGAVEDA